MRGLRFGHDVIRYEPGIRIHQFLNEHRNLGRLLFGVRMKEGSRSDDLPAKIRFKPFQLLLKQDQLQPLDAVFRDIDCVAVPDVDGLLQS